MRPFRWSYALVLACVACLSSNSAYATDSPIASARLSWKALPSLPNPLGVAGPFVGVHQGVVIVAGGANFPEPVWSNAKRWLDDIWVFSDSGEGQKWESAGRLPRPLAYGAAVSTDQGVICIGGNDNDRHYQEVFLLQWDDKERRITTHPYPSLPSPFAYGQATMIGHMVYVVGGQSDLKLETAMSNLWCLDLSKQSDQGSFQWRALQSMPTPGRAFNITAHQSDGQQDCLYVVGGRRQVSEHVQFLNDVWEFNPKTSLWRQRTSAPRAVAAGTGIGFGDQEIFVLGGDDGALFSETEKLKDKHPGFRKEAFGYNAVTDKWTSLGAIPQNQVTTIPVMLQGRIILVSGELRPRVRTPAAWSIEPLTK